MAHRTIDPAESLPQLEERVLARWRERDIFRESMRRREGAQNYVFYEGPPTANGRPGSHHVLARAFKDIFPRFHTMRGKRVMRKGGWDCHGLPVEIAVEQKLGFHHKDDIEAYGIAKFNAQCRESVFEFLEDWTALTERIGMWVDLDDPYRTMDSTYVESVWWALKQLFDKDLLQEGHKVVPYCTRCGTALSSHEVAQGYEDVEDPSVYVKFPLEEDPDGPPLLIWTTTPWTLVSNAAVAVDPELTYVKTAQGILAEARVFEVLGENAPVLERLTGADLVGKKYIPPFPYIASDAYGEKGHTVLPADFVSAEDGTGLVHTAVAFGEDDYKLGTEAGLIVVNPVKLDGTYDERIGEYAGRWVKDADNDLIADLESRGRMLKSTRFMHSYPHCWRCGTPLIYYAKPSWFVRTSVLRDRLLAANENVTWYPEHIKHGRFGNWLENNVDWAISRERYWGTPLPIWRNDAGETVCIGSFEELEQLSGVKLEDPHRPYVDEVEIPSPTGGEPLRRDPSVIDVWFDSGSMPFAQWHYPFENQATYEDQYPADFICEALDQTRGWFYSLLAIGALLFDRAPYDHVVCVGLITDADGKKMSKSLGNVVVPWEVIDAHGADAFRWYYFTSKQPWDGYRFSVDAVGEGVRQFLLQLLNTAAFLVTYANAGDVRGPSFGPKLSLDPEVTDDAALTDLDRWALSRLAATVEEVTNRLEDYDATFSGRAIAAFVDDLSNWYVRRSRRRFWDAEPAAFAVLGQALTTVAQLLAPFTPFIADELYDVLDGAEPSVHLTDWPVAGTRDLELEQAMTTARQTVRLGLAARGQAKIGVRRPLKEAVIVAAGAERRAIERLADIVQDELNVKHLRFVDNADELGSYSIKPNYRSLGPRFGKRMPQVAAAVGVLDPAHVADALREGATIAINIDGHDHELEADDLTLAMLPLDGYQLEREGSHAVALDLTIDDALRREGLAREVVRHIQNARKAAGLAVEDRIALTVGGADELLAAVRHHDDYVTGETLATSLTVSDDGVENAHEAQVEGLNLKIGVVKA